VVAGPRKAREVQDAYGIALAALALSIVLLIASGAAIDSLAALVAVVLQVLALAVTMRVSGSPRRTLIVGLCVMGLIAAAGIAGAVSGGKLGTFTALGGWLVLVAMAVWSIVRRLARYRRVTLPLVLGLLCVYLLLGLSFGLIYGLINVASPPALSPAHQGISKAVYFSFVTLTTVGYGDIAPANATAQAVSVLEAILGQLYLVSIVSLAVSRLGAGRREPDSRDA